MKEWFRGPKSYLERLRESDLIDISIHFEVCKSTHLEILISIDTRDRAILTRRELFPVEGELETFDFPVSPLRLNPSPISLFTPFNVRPQSLEIGDANDNENGQGPVRIPLKDHMLPKMTNHASPIVLPPTTGQFELRNALINSLPKFSGGEYDGPYVHVRDFDDLMFLQKYRNENEMEAMKLVLFPFSLLGKAKSWLQALQPKSITSLEMLTKAFYKKFLSLEKAETLRKFTEKDDVEGLDFLEEMAKKLKTWGTMRETDIQEKGGNAFGVRSNSNSKATLATILRKIESLEIGKNKMSIKTLNFHVEMQACVACDDVGHYTQDCPLIYEIRETRKDQVNVFHQKPSSFLYNQSHHQGNSLRKNNSNNYSGRPYYQGSNSNQNQGDVSFTLNHQPFQQNTPYVPPQYRKPSSDDGIQALLQSINQLMQQFMQMNQQSMSRIETSIAQLASGLSTRDNGTFPSQTQLNPKDQTESLHRDQANAVITLRSGRTVDNKVRMPKDKSRESPNPSTEKVVEGGKPIYEETPFVVEETGQVSLSHMELIYQICANTGMYSLKDELFEKHVELSNTRVPHGEALPASGTTGSGEVAKDKRRRVEPSGESREKVAEGGSTMVDDLKKVEERARLAVLQEEEDTSMMFADLVKGIWLGIEEETRKLKKANVELVKELARSRADALKEVRQLKVSHAVAISQLPVETNANLDEMVEERDILRRHLMLNGYSEEEVDTIKANTYVEEEIEEEAEAVGIVDVRGMSLRINDLESGLSGERETSKSLLSAHAELLVKLDSSRSREDDVLMCNQEFTEHLDRMKEANENIEDQYVKAHFRLVVLTQAISDQTLQVEEKDYETNN
ncbi:hypothetical protein GIB67_039785 [Kingdonia uniflora]|uniref:CCHC-type domain-containing protein n=1 Tax=Kingdonia uniflora TaxID=39325 RepID=A0A7J7P3W7_9MAGN|nr:hypothetical protein GIB67_039785 [Kingdonia uniflora]